MQAREARGSGTGDGARPIDAPPMAQIACSIGPTNIAGICIGTSRSMGAGVRAFQLCSMRSVCRVEGIGVRGRERLCVPPCRAVAHPER